MAKEEKINEELKANNQIKWVKMMNNIKERAEEVVINEIVYEFKGYRINAFEK